jgi:hypothetical protein
MHVTVTKKCTKLSILSSQDIYNIEKEKGLIIKQYMLLYSDLAAMENKKA